MNILRLQLLKPERKLLYIFSFSSRHSLIHLLRPLFFYHRRHRPINIILVALRHHPSFLYNVVLVLVGCVVKLCGDIS